MVQPRRENFKIDTPGLKLNRENNREKRQTEDLNTQFPQMPLQRKNFGVLKTFLPTLKKKL